MLIPRVGRRMSERAADADETRKRELVADAGRLLQQMSPQIVEEMTELLATRVGGLDQDPLMVDMLRASIDGNVWTLGHLLINDIGTDSMQPTTAAVEYAVRLAQRDVPLGSLTRAYYLGQAMLVRRGIDAVDQLHLDDKDLQMDLVRLVTDVTHNYFDWILKYVTEVHVKEQRKWWAARAVTNAATVLKVLRSEPMPPRSFEAETGYPLEHRHLACIAWLEYDTEDPEDQQRVDQLIRRAATALYSTRAPLITASDRLTAWAWMAVPKAEIDPQSLRELEALAASGAARNIRLAFGVPGQGVEGFRRSHEQAKKARQVALGAQRYQNARLTAFGDPNVAFLSLVMHDTRAALTWTKEVLGAVASGGAGNAVLRETLETFLATGENVTKTASVLDVHRNTVRQRVSRFLGERGSQRVDGLEIALALRLFDLLGDSSGAAHPGAGEGASA